MPEDNERTHTETTTSSSSSDGKDWDETTASTSSSSEGSEDTSDSSADSPPAPVHKGMFHSLLQNLLSVHSQKRPRTRQTTRMASGMPPSFPPMAMLIPFPFFPPGGDFLYPPPPPPLPNTDTENSTEEHEDDQERSKEETEEEFSDHSPVPKRMRVNEKEVLQNYNRDEKAYYHSLHKTEKLKVLEREKELKERNNPHVEPMRFKILKSDMDAATKALVLAKVEQFNQMWEGSGEYNKLKNWLQAVMRLPLGIYNRLSIQPSDPTEKIAEYLQGVRRSLDNTVYGHDDSKNQMMRIIAQWVSNPDSRGQVIGISGPPGVGKTVLVKEGICKALGLPFGFIALGGASDGSFLDGHSYTYEGSTYGKIAEILMKTKCVNPILFFDELDKVSQTRRGDEINNILVHLTDVSQNERFQDRYFGEIELDLSRTLIVFSYNDESLINPILKDRMITIQVKGYSTKEKLRIASGYLLPELLCQYRLSAGDVVFGNEIIEAIIQRVPEEQGVRNLKRGLESIISWLNMYRYVPEPDIGKTIGFPVVVTEEHVRKYLKKQEDPTAAFMRSLYT